MPALPSAKRVPAAVETAKWEFQKALSLLLQGIEDKTFFCGDRFTVADILIGQTLAWAKHQNLLSHDPVLESYMARLFGRPAFVAAQRIENSKLA